MSRIEKRSTLTAAGGSAPSAPAGVASSPRLMSLDALRGFDMFWILGGDALASAFHNLGDNPVSRVLGEQLEHVEWAGFHFYDLIFPMFVFIVGVSLVFSLGRTLQQHGRAEAVKRVIRRSLLIYLVGIFYSGGFSTHWPDIRLLGVLNRIALAYLFAGLVFCYCSRRTMVAIAASLIVGYWAMMSFVPFPDVRPVDESGRVLSAELTATNVSQLNFAGTNQLRGVFEPGLNLAHYVDQKYLPGKKWNKTWDPEGLLSTLPAIASCLLGVFAGLLLQSRTVEDRRKVAWLVGIGAASVVAGFLWSAQFPVIKKIWSSSFVLVAGGYSAILLGVFYLIVDVLKFQRWCVPFVWIGMNPITLYLIDNVVSNRRVSLRFFGGDVKAFLDAQVAVGAGDVLISLGEVGFPILVAWFLYRRKLFLRL